MKFMLSIVALFYVSANATVIIRCEGWSDEEGHEEAYTVTLTRKNSTLTKARVFWEGVGIVSGHNSKPERIVNDSTAENMEIYRLPHKEFPKHSHKLLISGGVPSDLRKFTAILKYEIDDSEMKLICNQQEKPPLFARCANFLNILSRRKL